jgi:hypothetical protein
MNTTKDDPYSVADVDACAEALLRAVDRGSTVRSI